MKTLFAVRQASSSDRQRSVKLNKSKIRPRVNAAEMEYEAENELNLIPSKQDSTKENKSVEMLNLLRSVQKEQSTFRTDVNTLKKAKEEVRDHRGNRKICVKAVLKMMRKFALTVLNFVGRVILSENARQARETGGD